MNVAIRRIGLVVMVLFIGLVAQLTYLQIGRAHQLANSSANPRKLFENLRRDRGPILTADNVPVALSAPSGDEYKNQRVYPPNTATLFADVVGYESLELGSAGVERAYASQLEGRTLSLNLHNLADAFANKQPVGTVVLTLSDLAQGTAAFALHGRRGSVVVLDVQTGGVLAAYSNPTYDPNLLASHDTKKVQNAYAMLSKDPENPMLSRSWRELYPPGSTFKTVTASIALQNNVDVNKQFSVVDHIILPQTNGVPLYNFGHEHCGGSMLDGFIVSCNTTFARVGEDLGELLATGAQQFGVQTEPPRMSGSGIDPPIVASTGPIPGTFQHNVPKFMQDAIGQNQVLVPPMQMALVAEAIANQGSILEPRFVDCVLDPTNRVVERVPVKEYKRAIDPPAANTMREYMLSVVNDPRGTGTAAQIPGVQVAGKTGTAETATGEKPHAWFIAFAPADHPKYAVAVLVEHGGDNAAETTGGRVAAPVAKEILQTLLTTPTAPSPCSRQPAPSTNGR